MFNNDDKTTSELATMDDILGSEVGEVAIYESNQWAAGPYIFKLHAYELKTYEIKNEEHPDVGSEAPMLVLRLVCVAVDDKHKYKDLKNKVVALEEVQEKVGRAYTETCLFGNDHLKDDRTGQARQSGARKFATLMHHILGEKEYEAVKHQPRQAQLDLAMNNIFIADMRVNTDRRTGEKQTQLDIINDFKVIGTVDEHMEMIAPAINAYEESVKQMENKE